MNEQWKHSTLRIVPVFCLALLCSGAGGEVYRWTDQQGGVHYGSFPRADDAQRIELKTEPPPGDGAIDDQQRRERQRRLLDSYAYEREQKRAAAQKAAHERSERRAQCARLERHWRTLSVPARVYLKGEDGQREFLSDTQRAARKQELQSRYRANCSGELR